MKIQLGRYVLAAAAIIYGVFTLSWRGFNVLQQSQTFGSVPHREFLTYLAAAIELLAGLAILFPKTARAAALALGILFTLFAVSWIPGIISQPKVYANWGAFFYPFSVAAGAFIASVMLAPNASPRLAKLAQFSCISFGLCLISFGIEQIEFFAHTTELVPKWIPPGQNFWAWATTIAFFLAAISLLAGRFALLAAQLTTAMLIAFGVLIWLPVCFGNVHNLFNWSENIENLAIAGAAWLLADYLRQHRSFSRTP